MPDITDIQPRGGVSNGSDQTANTELTIRGKGLAGVKKVLITIQYGNPRYPFENQGLEEASIIRIDNDGQMVFRLPQLNRTLALSGGVYVNCRVYILTENTSLYASQPISIPIKNSHQQTQKPPCSLSARWLCYFQMIALGGGITSLAQTPAMQSSYSSASPSAADHPRRRVPSAHHNERKRIRCAPYRTSGQ